jgi:hypothetical protein
VPSSPLSPEYRLALARDMVAGEGSSDQATARLWAYRDRTRFSKLIDFVVEISITCLDGQVRAGRQASLTGTLSNDDEGCPVRRMGIGAAPGNDRQHRAPQCLRPADFRVGPKLSKCLGNEPHGRV